MLNRGSLIVISAPSGAGKTSLVQALLERDPYAVVSVSHTTRTPREGEGHGKNYFFVTEQEFQEKVKANHFLEYAKVFEKWYGTSKEFVIGEMNKGRDVILEIDWQGFQIIRSKVEALSIFILPPSKEALLERLKTRAKDKLEVIEYRMQQANLEVSHFAEYDYLLVNDNFDETVQNLMAILRANRHRREKVATHLKPLLAQFVEPTNI